ncbi:MAG: hypothetical protein KatS3mg077_2760 [Candidatus Binatia bacterium]|nr:MAG: hypothetical protein KatS3mg077_2760 [Candidatus Binatia bacterium]
MGFALLRLTMLTAGIRFVFTFALGASLLVHGAARAATFYVAPSGDDTATGDLERPWRTIQFAVNQAMAGDVVVVQPGLYRESVTITRAGTQENPIRIAGQPGATLESPDPLQSLSAFDLRPGSAYVAIEGFEVRGGFHETIFLRSGVHDIALARLHVHGNRAGLWIAGAENVQLLASLIEGNSVTGIRVYQGSRNVVIRDTDSIHNDDGLGCDGNADGFSVEPDVTTFRCVRCRAIGNGEDGFDIAASDVSIEQSWALDNGCAGVKLFRGSRMESSVVARNHTGVSTTSVSPDGAFFDFRHLTVADNAGTGLLVRSPLAAFTQSPYTVRMSNSIVAGASKAVEVEGNATFVGARNILFRPDSTAPVLVVRKNGNASVFSGQGINAGLYGGQAEVANGTLAVDPEFAEAVYYTLGPTSPAIDRGVQLSEGGPDVTGQPRTHGLSPDIGAHESSTTLPDHPPWPDPGPPRLVIAGTWLRLTAFGSVDPDGNALTYAWDFADGTATVLGFTVRHLYLEPGRYSVELAVSDGANERRRATQVAVDWPPTSHWDHDTAILPVPPQRVSIRKGQTQTARTLRVRVQNADLSPTAERYGHIVQLSASDGNCPPGTVVVQPDFERLVAGSQQRALLSTGKSRTARIALRFTRSAAPGCTIILRAETYLPNNHDPNPDNNQVSVPFTVLDRNLP